MSHKLAEGVEELHDAHVATRNAARQGEKLRPATFFRVAAPGSAEVIQLSGRVSAARYVQKTCDKLPLLRAESAPKPDQGSLVSVLNRIADAWRSWGDTLPPTDLIEGHLKKVSNGDQNIPARLAVAGLHPG